MKLTDTHKKMLNALSYCRFLPGSFDEKENQINKIAREINTGFEMRNHTCEVIRDFAKLTKKSYLNGVLVKEEKLTNADFTLFTTPEPMQKEPD